MPEDPSLPDEPLPASRLDLQAVSRAALITALAVGLPPVFHMLKLGAIFLPMYLPILAGAFFLPWRWAAATGAAAPLISALMTGMPPFYPPVAVWLAGELLTAGCVTSLVNGRFRVPSVVSVGTGLIAARAVQALLVFFTASWMDLPPRMLTLAAFAGSWPGMVLALLAVPAAVALIKKDSTWTKPQES